MLTDRKNFLALHRGWFVATSLIGLAAIAWYSIDYFRQGRAAPGSSVVGLTFGTAAALIIAFEFLLVFRKTWLFRTNRSLGTAKTWMKAHIWLGLLAVPLAIMHSGLSWGGWLTTILGALFLIVIASGVYGLVMQNVLPRLMLDVVPGETIHTQIDEVSRQFAVDAWRMAGLYGGVELPPERRERLRLDATEVPPQEVYGAPRRVGTIVKRSPHPERDLPQGTFTPELTLALTSALTDDIEPFLLTGKSRGDRLASQQRIAWYFEELRRRVGQREAHAAIESMEALCQRRRQLNLQQIIHFWLHNWLAVHLPLSVALVVLLVGHIWFALRYN